MQEFHIRYLSMADAREADLDDAAIQRVRETLQKPWKRVFIQTDLAPSEYLLIPDSGGIVIGMARYPDRIILFVEGEGCWQISLD